MFFNRYILTVTVLFIALWHGFVVWSDNGVISLYDRSKVAFEALKFVNWHPVLLGFVVTSPWNFVDVIIVICIPSNPHWIFSITVKGIISTNYIFFGRSVNFFILVYNLSTEVRISIETKTEKGGGGQGSPGEANNHKSQYITPKRINESFWGMVEITPVISDCVILKPFSYIAKQICSCYPFQKKTQTYWYLKQLKGRYTKIQNSEENTKRKVPNQMAK